MINSIVSQGLIWAILGLGIFMTFRILDFQIWRQKAPSRLEERWRWPWLLKGSTRSLRRWLLLVQGVWRDLRQVFSTQKEESRHSCQGSSWWHLVTRSFSLSCSGLIWDFWAIKNSGISSFCQWVQWDSDWLDFRNACDPWFDLLLGYTLGSSLYCDRGQSRYGQELWDQHRPDGIDGLGHFKWDYCSFWCTDGPARRLCGCFTWDWCHCYWACQPHYWRGALFKCHFDRALAQYCDRIDRLPILIWAVIALGINTSYIRIFSALILAICLMIPTFKGKIMKGAKLSKWQQL